MIIRQDWQLGCSDNKDDIINDYFPAAVPGNVQKDYAEYHGFGDIHYGKNAERYAGLEEKYWRYRTRLNLENTDGKRIFLKGGGIDYEYEIVLNGSSIYHYEGMFRPIEIELTGKVRQGDLLEVLIYPAPKRKGSFWHDRQESDHSFKPCISYKWDMHPYVVVLGIWNDLYIETTEQSRIESAELFYTLNEDRTRADIRLQATKEGDGQLETTLFDRDGRQVIKTNAASFSIDNPNLWWCNGQGEPYLYSYSVKLIVNGAVADEKTGRIGFRTLKMEMNEGSWFVDGWPKSRACPPMTVVLNGRKIFLKGSNWVSPEIFTGTIDAETYRPLLTLAKEANFNIIRTWGGAIINKEPFFEQCDELGLLLWTEFPLACNCYPDDEHYLSVLKSEATAIIKRLRRHPSVAVWCGGNELFNQWSGMTDQSLPLRHLNALCLEHDPGRPFFPTAPVMGMGHGVYIFYDRFLDRDAFQTYAQAHCTAYTEFGVPSAPPADYLRTFIPEDELFPPKEGGSWEYHHAFRAWWPESWLCLNVIEKYFGEQQSLEQLCENSALLQCVGYKAIFEEARRQKPYCSAAINWCFNEPWKTAANNNIVCYPAIPKDAYYAVKEACRGALWSAAFPRFDYHGGEQLPITLWLLNDSPEDVAPADVEVVLTVGDKKINAGSYHTGTAANENKKCCCFYVTLPEFEDAELMQVELICKQQPELSSSYTLRYYKKEQKKVTRMLND